jgi:hypothetical protein
VAAAWLVMARTGGAVTVDDNEMGEQCLTGWA